MQLTALVFFIFILSKFILKLKLKQFSTLTKCKRSHYFLAKQVELLKQLTV